MVEVHRQLWHEVEYCRRVYRSTQSLVGSSVHFRGREAAQVAEAVAHLAPDRDHQFDVADAVLEADQVRATVGQLGQRIGGQAAVGAVVHDHAQAGGLADFGHVFDQAVLARFGQVVRQQQQALRAGFFSFLGVRSGDAGRATDAGQDRYLAFTGIDGSLDDFRVFLRGQREELARAAGSEQCAGAERRQPFQTVDIRFLVEVAFCIEVGDRERQQARGKDFFQALAAVTEVGAHGGSGRFGVLAQDGPVDIVVLAVHALEVGGRVGMRQLRRVDARARDDGVTEVAQDVDKIAVAGGLGDEQVEMHVRLHRARLPCRALDALQRRAHLLHLLFAAAGGSQPGRFGFQADAQLEDGQHIADGADGVGRDAQVGRLRLQDKGADAMARLHQPGRLQVRNRFAHDGAAHAMHFHDHRFGGQFFARLQGARLYALGKALHHALGEVAVLFTGHRRGRGGRSRGNGGCCSRGTHRGGIVGGLAQDLLERGVIVDEAGQAGRFVGRRQGRGHGRQALGDQQGVAQAQRRRRERGAWERDDGQRHRIGNAELFHHFAGDDFLRRAHPVGRVVQQARQLVGAGQQIKAPGIVHDAGKQGGIGIGGGQLAGNHIRQRGHVRRVAPQLLGLGAQVRVADAGAELAHHHGGGHRIQMAVADACHGRAHAGDRHAAAVEYGRVGQRHGPGGQHGLGQDMADDCFGIAIGIGQGQLQAQGRVDAGRKDQLAARGLRHYLRDLFQFKHSNIIAVTDGETSRDSSQVVEGTAVAVFADRMHFPGAVMTVDLGHDLGRMRALHGQVEARDFGAVVGVDQAAVGVFHLREGLAGKAVDGKHQALDRWRHGVQVDVDLLVVTIAGAGAVVARVHHAAILAAQLAEPDHVHRTVGFVEHDDRRVEVDRFALRAETEEALGLDGIPAQAHGLERRAVARADQDLAAAGKAQHHALAAGLAVDQVAEKAAAAAGGHRNFVAQAVVPRHHVRVVDHDIAARRHFQLRHRTEARHRHLAAAAGLGDEETAALGEQRIAQALRAHLQFHAFGRGDERAVAEHVLLAAHVENLHRAGQLGRQQAIAVAAHRFDVLLEEGLAIGEASHDGGADAAGHLALEIKGLLHHHHRVRLAVNLFTACQRHVQEGIDITGHRKFRHDESFPCLNADAERGGKWAQAALEALADSLELPIGAVAIHLAEDHGRFRRTVFRQVVTGDFGIAVGVDGAHERLLDLAEVLLAGVAIVDGDADRDALDFRWHGGQVDGDGFVIAVAVAGAVVARVGDGAVGRFQVVVEDEVVVGADFAICLEQEGRTVQVERAAIGGAHVPAEADDDFRQAWGFFAQINVTAFLQTDCHGRFLLTTVTYRGPDRGGNERHTYQAGEDFRHVELHTGQHDRRQDTDGVVGAVFQEHELIKRTLLHQIHRHRPHEHRTNSQAQHDDHDVGGDRKGADHAVKAERSIEHFQVQETTDTALLDHVAHTAAALFLFFQQAADGVDTDVHQDAPQARDQHHQLLRFGDQAHTAQQYRQRNHHRDRGHLAQRTEFLLEVTEPVHFLVAVEQEVQEHQQQEHAAEGRHFRVVIGQVHRIRFRVVQRQRPYIHDADVGRHGHDDQREQQAHTEHGDDDADAKKQLLPERVPVLQHRGVHYRVIERQRHFHRRQNDRDTERRQRSAPSAQLVTPPAGQRQADKGHEEGNSEMLHGILSITSHNLKGGHENQRLELSSPVFFLGCGQGRRRHARGRKAGAGRADHQHAAVAAGAIDRQAVARTAGTAAGAYRGGQAGAQLLRADFFAGRAIAGCARRSRGRQDAADGRHFRFAAQADRIPPAASHPDHVATGAAGVHGRRVRRLAGGTGAGQAGRGADRPRSARRGQPESI
uniref:Uncharacterized protein n=1 Tax=Tanacetum cinerariifolium TaxID=118510 RepID=A0A699GE54_TANCI|nr:hypothetical protein [Tanacetum cinerariifolium]